MEHQHLNHHWNTIAYDGHVDGYCSHVYVCSGTNH
jgi:hypothetical protein